MRLLVIASIVTFLAFPKLSLGQSRAARRAKSEREKKEIWKRIRVADKKKMKRDLLPSSTLRIGVTSRPIRCRRKTKSRSGDKLRVHYNGTLYSDGRQIDSSIDREQPFDFILGAGQVMKGWDLGLHGMCLKEQRKLTIPSDLAYGKAGAAASEGRIPPGATLVYSIELLRITRGDK